MKSPLDITSQGLTYMSTRVIELHIQPLKRYAVSFSHHKTHGGVPPPPFEPVQHWEFRAVVCSGVTLRGGFGYK